MLGRVDLLISKSGNGGLQRLGAVMLRDHDHEAVRPIAIARTRVSEDADSQFLTYLRRLLYATGVFVRSSKRPEFGDAIAVPDPECSRLLRWPRPNHSALATGTVLEPQGASPAGLPEVQLLDHLGGPQLSSCPTALRVLKNRCDSIALPVAGKPVPRPGKLCLPPDRVLVSKAVPASPET